MKRTAVSEQQTRRPEIPATHDDLTIAENVRGWKSDAPAEEGWISFNDGRGETLKLPLSRVDRFLHEFGPLHPGDYREKFGRDWREDFAKLAADGS